MIRSRRATCRPATGRRSTPPGPLAGDRDPADRTDQARSAGPAPSTAPIPPTRHVGRFTVRYVCALMLVAMLCASAYVAVSRLVTTQSSAAAQVNVAGRQRMLSQRIALRAGLLPDAAGQTRAALRSAMTADVDALAAGQRGLLQGDSARNLPGHASGAVAALYRGGTAAAVDHYVATARGLLRAAARGPAPSAAGVASLQAQALGPLSTKLDSVVQAYQRESEQRIAAILRAEQLLLALTLLTLLGEALLVFRPMNRRIERETDRLGQASARYRAEAARHAFGLRLREAIDLTDNEPDLYATVLQAVGAGGVPGQAQLLLTADGHGMAAAAGAGAHGCSVPSAGHCPVLRRGRTMSFPHSREMGACTHLRADAAAAGAGAVASTCVPVTFLGTGIGVLRTVTGAGQVLPDSARAALETVASTAGTHIGTLRASARSRLDAEGDPLTGLLNRRGLEEAVNRLEGQRCPYVVVLADLDHFKAINDRFGHDAGDAVLVQAARAMTSVLRPGDVLARHGGEEFVVVVPILDEGRAEATGLAAGVAVAERIRAAMAANHERGNGPSCTASLGVAGPVVEGLEAGLRRADAALYLAKSRGRNRVEVASDTTGELPRGTPGSLSDLARTGTVP